MVILVAFHGHKRLIIRTVNKDSKTSAPQITVELLRRGDQVSKSTVRNVCKTVGYHGRDACRKDWTSEQSRWTLRTCMKTILLTSTSGIQLYS